MVLLPRRVIANAKILPRVHERLLERLIDLDVPTPIIGTPEALLGKDTEADD